VRREGRTLGIKRRKLRERRPHQAARRSNQDRYFLLKAESDLAVLNLSEEFHDRSATIRALVRVGPPTRTSAILTASAR
jgi:hypothetical protein